MKSESNNLHKFALRRVSNALAILAGLALVLSPHFVPPCGHQIGAAGGMSGAMRCHWTFQVESLLAVAVVLVAGALWVVPHPQARRVVGGGLILFGLLVVAVTQSWVVGLCGNAAMACHETAHWLWLWSGLLVAVGGFVAVTARARVERTITTDEWDDPGSPAKVA